MTPEVWPLMRTLNEPVVVLKPVKVTVCCSLPPCSAFWMPAAVLFWPRTIGTLCDAPEAQAVRVAVGVIAGRARPVWTSLTPCSAAWIAAAV